MANKQIDWGTIRVEYESGADSIRGLASKHGITDAGIRKKAKKEGWEIGAGCKEHIDKKVKHMTELKKLDEKEAMMPAATRIEIQRQVVDRVAIINTLSNLQGDILENLLGHINHDRRIQADPDAPIDPQQYGKAKIAQDVLSQARKNYLGDETLLEAAEGGGKKDDDWLVAIPAMESKRLGIGRSPEEPDEIEG
jgi:hypothetical protein